MNIVETIEEFVEAGINDNVTSIFCELIKQDIHDLLGVNLNDLFSSYDSKDKEMINVFELWTIQEWLAYKLRQRGEKVIELSLLFIWCRTTTGQAIKLDDCIKDIYTEYIHKQ